MSYSIGFAIDGALAGVLPLVPKKGWSEAYDSDGFERDGAWVADITGMLNLSSWPSGTRVIVRKEVPHVGAQRQITLAAARAMVPERFSTGKDPKILALPDTAWINKPPEKTELEEVA